MDPRYIDVARLLVQVAPAVFETGDFALKGGTAINLFVRDMPRLSVDLDLVLRDGTLGRDDALGRIESALGKAKDRLDRQGLRVTARSSAGGKDTTLTVGRGRVSVKVEVNHVMRGTIRPVRTAALVAAAASVLKAEVHVPVLATDEVYGSKLVAAMDRQHPRDLFDVRGLLNAEGLTPEIVESFVAYLACHDRPIHEVLFPTLRDVTYEYAEHFVGMTASDVPLNDLLEAREHMVRDLPRQLTGGQRTFLSSLAQAEPDFVALELPNLEHLPGMRWKLENLRKLRNTNARKLEAQARALDHKLAELT